MAAKYQTKQGDTIDSICQAYYGRTSGAVEVVLEANPVLSFEEPQLEAGMEIILPDLPEPTTAVVRLF